jgi:hypothetical protein
MASHWGESQAQSLALPAAFARNEKKHDIRLPAKFQQPKKRPTQHSVMHEPVGTREFDLCREWRIPSKKAH